MRQNDHNPADSERKNGCGPLASQLIRWLTQKRPRWEGGRERERERARHYVYIHIYLSIYLSIYLVCVCV